jgi:hypothetical protein
VAEIAESASDSRVSPARVVAGYSDDQLLDLDRCLGTTNRAALAAIVLLGDQPPVPSKQGVWRHQGADLEEPFSADGLGLRGEATTLPISEPQTLSA